MQPGSRAARFARAARAGASDPRGRVRTGRNPGRQSWPYRRSAIVLAGGLVAFALGIAYLALPADKLWPFVPGHAAHQHLHLMPNALACLVVALALLIWAALSMPRVPVDQRPVLSRPRLVPRPDITVPPLPRQDVSGSRD